MVIDLMEKKEWELKRLMLGSFGPRGTIIEVGPKGPRALT
jgi:hypothetical protein